MDIEKELPDFLPSLLGHTLQSLEVGDDTAWEGFESALRVTTTGGNVLGIRTCADCCSETWFADITGAASAYGGVITGARLLDLPEPNDNRTRQEFDEQYGLEIQTTKGIVSIVYRNSSNGYYGGWVEMCTPEWMESSAGNWRLIDDDDWSA